MEQLIIVDKMKKLGLPGIHEKLLNLDAAVREEEKPQTAGEDCTLSLLSINWFLLHERRKGKKKLLNVSCMLGIIS